MFIIRVWTEEEKKKIRENKEKERLHRDYVFDARQKMKKSRK